MSRKIEYFIGIDEAGRGPLAGPISVGAVIIHRRYLNLFRAVRDSKQLTPKQREGIFDTMLRHKKEGFLDFSVSMVGSDVINKKGISYATRLSISRNLRKINPDPKTTHIFLDGLLKAPKKFVFQETVIGGDAKIPVVALASIAAKVLRDRKMVSFSKVFPEYLFDRHKGYGTDLHRSIIKKLGITPIHRILYLRNILQ